MNNIESRKSTNKDEMRAQRRRSMVPAPLFHTQKQPKRVKIRPQQETIQESVNEDNAEENRFSMSEQGFEVASRNDQSSRTKTFYDQVIDHLPLTLDLKAVERTQATACELCEKPFTPAIGKNPVRHCKRCGKSVCQQCSDQRRRLSKQDSLAYRTCDSCVTEMENFKIVAMHNEARKEQLLKMVAFDKQIAKLNQDLDKQELGTFEETKELKDEIYRKYRTMTQLKNEETNINKEIQNNKTAKQYLKGSIADLHQVLTHLEYERKRQRTRH